MIPAIASATYTEAAKSHQVAVDELMIALAKRCAEETRMGNVRPMGLRCRKCEHFDRGTCTLRDKVKNGHD